MMISAQAEISYHYERLHKISRNALFVRRRLRVGRHGCHGTHTACVELWTFLHFFRRFRLSTNSVKRTVTRAGRSDSDSRRQGIGCALKTQSSVAVPGRSRHLPRRVPPVLVQQTRMA